MDRPEAIDRLWVKYHVDPSLIPRSRIQVDMYDPGIAKYSARLAEVRVPVLVLAYAKFANLLYVVRDGVDNLRRSAPSAAFTTDFLATCLQTAAST